MVQPHDLNGQTCAPHAYAVPFRALDVHSRAAASLHVRHVLHITSERIPPGVTCSYASGMLGEHVLMP